MKLYLRCLVSLFFIINMVKAQERVELSISTADQHDDFQWSLAGNSNGNNPNIYSELTWKNLSGLSLQISVKAPVWKAAFVEVLFNQSITLTGNVNDTDYSEDNRVNPTFHADVKSNKGYTSDYNIASGYKFKNKAFSISPYLGYGISKQLMFVLDENVKGLNTSYEANWSGALVGFKFEADLKKRLHLETDLAYHQLKYYAKADWNLIDEFAHPVSFKHTAKGFRLEAKVKLARNVYKGLSAFIYAQNSFWNTGAGIDELFYENGNKAFTKLNQVERKSYSLGLGAKFSF